MIDCSVVAKWILDEPLRHLALALHDQWNRQEIGLIAPDILPVEFASLISKRCRRKEFDGNHAELLFRTMGKMAPPLIATLGLLPAAMSISLKHQMSLWDCVYIALAIERKCEFITADKRLVRGLAATRFPIRFLGDPQ